jgi:serine phosphatase RsbU (regulator of sigma subunit)
MSGYLMYFCKWQMSAVAVAKLVSFSILLTCATQQQLWSQVPSLSETLKLYDQAAGQKDYAKASQYAYEIAAYYQHAKDPVNSVDYLNLSLAHAKKTGDQTKVYSMLHQLGLHYMDTKKYSKALENFQSALTIVQKLNNGILIREELMNVSISYDKLDRVKKAIEYGEEALSLAITNNDDLSRQKCYQLLAEYYKKQGNSKKSLEYQTQFNLLVNAQQNEALKARQINELEQHVQTVGLEHQLTQAKLSEQAQKLHQTNSSLRIAERSLRTTTDYLQATSDSLKEIEAQNRQRQMEIDLLQKDKDLAEIKIKEQGARIQNETLARNFTLVGSMLAIALVAVLVISYRKKTKDNRKINQQNKNIKGSINYAKRIQEAMLPKAEQYPEGFQNSFILFMPRDTVSGDFYWLSNFKKDAPAKDVAFAAVDCTGHGVPGAFMSMIGINALNGLVSRGVTQTDKLLDALDQEIRTALQQNVSGNNDGMDVALCIYRQKEKVLEFSGAKNPLIYIQNNELFKVKGDTHSIGGRRTLNSFFFKKHEIRIDKPTVLYLFSDGYKDQFGGKDNTKFLGKKLNKLLLEIHHLPMHEQKSILELTINEWKGTREQTDDILVMGLKLEYSVD